MADRTIVTRLRAEISDFKRGMVQAAQSAKETAQKISKALKDNGAEIRQLTTQVGLVGLALTGMAVAAVSSAADFDQAMSSVQAVTHESAATMDLLRTAAIKAGKDTVFNATESANAIEEMAKAGVSAKDILAGGLDGALSLASAGSLDVATAAEIAATALNQFQLTGSDVAHVADLLAAGANKAQGDVVDLANALKFVGPVANGMGISIEETTAVLAEFASKGVIGEQAGTSLRGVLSSLTSPSAAARTEIQRLGVTLYDSQGKFLGLKNLAAQMSDAFVGMSDAERDAALGIIFGNQQITAARLLLDGGAQSVQDWTDKVNDQGFAAETAAIKLDNLKGDIEQFSGSVETALISIGSQGNGPLRTVVQQATEVVNKLGEMPPAAQGAALAIAGGGGLALLGIAGLGKLSLAFNEAIQAAQTLGITAKGASIAVSATGAALAVGTLALSAWADSQARAEASTRAFKDSLDKTTGAVTNMTREQIANELTTQQGWWIFKKDAAADSARIIGLSVDTITEAILGNKDALDQVTKATSGLSVEDGTLAAAAKNAGVGIADYANAQRTVAEEVQRVSERLGDGKDLWGQYRDAQAGATDSTNATNAAMQRAAIEAQAVSQATQDAQDALDKWRQVANDSDAAFLDIVDAYDAVVNANKEVGSTAAVTADQYIAELQRQVDAQSAWETNMVEIAQRVNDGMTGEMKDAANAMIDELLQLGPKGAQEVQLLHDMTDEQFAQVVSLWQQKGTAAVEGFTMQVESYRTPRIQVDADMSPARATLNQFVTDAAGIVTSIKIAGSSYEARAGGGYISGPGSSTSDSIPARLSNGEYVVKASSVAKYGKSFFDNVNAQRFASGGMVGGGLSASGGSSLAGLELTGTLDTPWGPATVRGIVRDEISARDRSAAAMPTTRGRLQ